MKVATVGGLVGLALVFSSQAQVPHILGTWKLVPEASDLAGPAPQTHVRRYWLTDDGSLVGLAVIVNAQGTPEFLQFAGKGEGKDYPEFSSGVLAQLQLAGTQTVRHYSERNIDAYTVEWVDKAEGRIVASGTREVSKDGRTMTIVAKFKTPQGESQAFRSVFEKQDAGARRPR